MTAITPDMREEWRTVLRANERLLGLTFCIRLLDPDLEARAFRHRLAHRYWLHQSAFCWPQKTRDPEACRQSCFWACRRDAVNQALPFTRRCHARASEIIIPVALAGTPAVLLHAGQFREGPDQPATLPLWSRPQVQAGLAVARSLQVWLADFCQRLLRSQPEAWNPITTFLDQHLEENPQLADLARHLKCSTAWAGEQVVLHCGCSWSALKQQHRLARARDLLARSSHKISTIARMVGVDDADYFSRWFTAICGASPRAWRHKHRATPPEA